LATENASLANAKRESLVDLQVAHGNQAAEQRDLGTALLWYAAALKNVGTNSDRENVHRTRIGSVLESQPRLLNQFVLKGPAYYCLFSPDGLRAAVVADDFNNEIRFNFSIFDLQKNKLSLEFHTTNTTFIGEFAFSPDGERFVERRGDFQMPWCRIFDAVNGNQILTRNSSGSELELLDTRDGQTAVFRISSNEVRVAEVGTGKPISPPIRNERGIPDVWMSPGGKVLCLVLKTADPDERRIQLVDGLTAQPKGPPFHLDQLSLYGHPDRYE
jgi:hypothetical protein